MALAGPAAACVTSIEAPAWVDSSPGRTVRRARGPRRRTPVVPTPRSRRRCRPRRSPGRRANPSRFQAGSCGRRWAPAFQPSAAPARRPRPRARAGRLGPGNGRAPIHRASHVGRDVVGGRVARLEPPVAPQRRLDPVDAKGPPVLATGVPGHQVPPAPGVYEAVGLDQPTAPLPLVVAIGEPQPLVVPGRGGDRGQDLRVHRRPRPRVRHGGRPHGADPAPHSRWKQLLELGEPAPSRYPPPTPGVARTG